MTNFQNNLKSNFQSALLSISFDCTQSKTLQAQLLDALRSIILEIPDCAGARLPSSRNLASELSVSRVTVQYVYDQLNGEGYLETRQGSGTYVAGELPSLPMPVSRIERENAPLQEWRPFQTGVPDQSLFSHKVWAQHIERAWRNPEKALLARPDPFGWQPLRETIADHLLAWRGLPCDPKQIVITSGASEALELIFCGLSRVGDLVAIEDPSWPVLNYALERMDCKSHPIRIDHNGLDAADIPAGASTIVVTPSRHFPTGITMPLSRRGSLLEWARQTDGLILEDDYDSEFRFKGQPLPSLSGLDGLQHCIYLGSFSKTLSSSLRIGYIVLPERYLEAVRSNMEIIGSRASLIPQPALATFMRSGEFAVHLRRMRRAYAKRQAHLINELSEARQFLKITPDSAGMHLLAPLHDDLMSITSDSEIASFGAAYNLTLRALSPLSSLPNPPQGLLLGYAGFDEMRLTQSAKALTGLLRENFKIG